MASYSSEIVLSDGLQINSSKPIDVRSIVDSVNDLTSISYAYMGMVVGVKGTSDLYVLTSNAKGAKTLSNWKKTGSESAAVILDSVSQLTDGTTISSPFKGMIAVVNDDSSESDSSEDEGAIYILLNTPATTKSNWLKIGGGSTVESNAEITTDGTTPESGNGFSIDPDDSDAYVEENYVSYSNGILPKDIYYSGNGFGSYNGGYGNLEGVTESVEFTKGSSSIKFWAYGSENSLGNWIKFDLVDNSFGITYSDVIDEDGNAYTSGQFDVENGVSIKFLKDLDFSGATETRDPYDEEHTFGVDDGCTISDLDIYTTKILPTVYAYAGDTSVRVLTEGDKTEIITMIETNIVEPETITEDEINSLFDDSSDSDSE